uniref:Uncharacterized protein n=1 Tax=Yersinia enterocolitica W22703 TaxID=913028 RepID=F4N019_YEREN|nr:unknown protein [Yersinia enterocolitica W22703]
MFPANFFTGEYGITNWLIIFQKKIQLMPLWDGKRINLQSLLISSSGSVLI